MAEFDEFFRNNFFFAGFQSFRWFSSFLLSTKMVKMGFFCRFSQISADFDGFLQISKDFGRFELSQGEGMFCLLFSVCGVRFLSVAALR